MPIARHVANQQISANPPKCCSILVLIVRVKNSEPLLAKMNPTSCLFGIIDRVTAVSNARATADSIAGATADSIA